jgi:hypothetical protein
VKITLQRYQKQSTPSTGSDGAFFIPEASIFFKTFLMAAPRPSEKSLTRGPQRLTSGRDDSAARFDIRARVDKICECPMHAPVILRLEKPWT